MIHKPHNTAPKPSLANARYTVFPYCYSAKFRLNLIIFFNRLIPWDRSFVLFVCIAASYSFIAILARAICTFCILTEFGTSAKETTVIAKPRAQQNLVKCFWFSFCKMWLSLFHPLSTPADTFSFELLLLVPSPLCFFVSFFWDIAVGLYIFPQFCSVYFSVSIHSIRVFWTHITTHFIIGQFQVEYYRLHLWMYFFIYSFHFYWAMLYYSILILCFFRFTLFLFQKCVKIISFKPTRAHMYVWIWAPFSTDSFFPQII